MSSANFLSAASSYAVTQKEKDELPKFLKTECGESLKKAMDCVQASYNQIKGIECDFLIKAYYDCCAENPDACAERFHPENFQPDDQDDE